MLLVLLTAIISQLLNKESHIRMLQNHRFDFYAVLIDMEQNFLDFSDATQRYVNTQDNSYKTLFQRFLQIDTTRDLKLLRNKTLNELNIYNKSQLTEEEVDAVQKFFDDIHLPKDSKRILKAREFSLKLLELDVEAINAMSGYFKDTSGRYTIIKPANIPHAQDILNSEQYQIIKNQVHKSVNDLFDYIEGYMEEYIEEQTTQKQWLYEIAITLFCLFLILIAYGMYYSKRVIIDSLSTLLEWIRWVKKGKYSFKRSKIKEKEVAMVMDAFHDMAHTIEENIQTLKHLSQTDELTNLSNRRTLHESMQREHYQFTRYETPCSVVLMDIDYFKHINDTYGHDAGDEVLKQMAEIMTNNIRLSDTLGRWGGEEFLIVCPNTNQHEVRILANTLRQKIQNHDFKVSKSITASFGTSSFSSGLSVDEIVKKADEALYIAKENGRNQVV